MKLPGNVGPRERLLYFGDVDDSGEALIFDHKAAFYVI